MDPASSHYTGQRLSFSARPCSIRYVGGLPGTKGSWLGVEWDSPLHGKHDGTYDGKRYFTCLRSSSTIASFVRPSRQPDPPRSFIDAVRGKYAPASSFQPTHGTAEYSSDSFADDVIAAAAAEDARVREQQLNERPVRFGTKLAEEVGFDKISAQQSNLAGLKVVALAGLHIDGLVTRSDLPEESSNAPVGPEWWAARRPALSEVRESLPRVIELDLTNNLVERWSDVVAICSGLPQLQVLRLSGNRFRDLDVLDSISEYRTAFHKVEELVLDATFLSWQQVVILTEYFPSLSTLSVAFNALNNISESLSRSTIKSISLNANSFVSLSSIAGLSGFPSLETLTLQSNQITDLYPCPNFPRLRSLDLSDNAIPNLASLTPLSPPETSANPPLPSLTSIRLSRNPFFASLQTDLAHILTLARLPNIRKLNYSRISPEERSNAELYYLGLIARQLEGVPDGSSAEQAILAEHPLWDDLCRKYEKPELHRSTPTAKGDFAPSALGARIMMLNIKAAADAVCSYRALRGEKAPSPVDAESYEGREEDGWSVRTVRVARGTSVYALMGVVAKVFGVLPLHFRLIWETGEWDAVGRGAGTETFGTAGDGANRKESDEDDDMWSLPSIDEDDEVQNEARDEVNRGKWVKREIEIEAGTSSVGFWVEGRTADVRLEIVTA